ncbi:coadhesin-like [Lycorma delicatula]|uniref:coadhesin-like n=1 Tax=Lycorma delicatula TaxID=130591 RepID=UPI003F518B50
MVLIFYKLICSIYIYSILYLVEGLNFLFPLEFVSFSKERSKNLTIGGVLLKNTDNPSVNSWSLWSPWSCCAGECGHLGYQIRRRICLKKITSNYEPTCVGKSKEFRGCNLHGCQPEKYERLVENDPVKSSVYAFLKNIHAEHSSLMTRCLITDCRFDTVHNILGGLSDQYWNALQCIKHNIGCPVHGDWGEWAPWSRCSAWCGKGIRFRCRYCNRPFPSRPQLHCLGDNCTFVTCLGKDCSFHQGSWSKWSDWGPCSATCGYGIIRKFRNCVTKRSRRNFKTHFFNYLQKNNIFMKLHNTSTLMATEVPKSARLVLPLDTKISPQMSTLSPVKSFTPDRKATKLSSSSLPPSIFHKLTATSFAVVTSTAGGTTSSFTTTKKKTVNITPYFHASISGNAQGKNESNIVHDKRECDGPYEIIKPCYIEDCPVDGGWSDWSAWTPCSTDCGQGTQIRTRACSNPPAQAGGAPCPGPVSWFRHCYQIPCEGNLQNRFY